MLLVARRGRARPALLAVVVLARAGAPAAALVVAAFARRRRVPADLVGAARAVPACCSRDRPALMQGAFALDSVLTESIFTVAPLLTARARRAVRAGGRAARLGRRGDRRHGRARRRAAARRRRPASSGAAPPAGSARSRCRASARSSPRCCRSASRSARSRSRCPRSPTPRAGRSWPACWSRCGRSAASPAASSTARARGAGRSPACTCASRCCCRSASCRSRSPTRRRRWRCSSCPAGLLIAPLIATRNELAGPRRAGGRADRGLHVAAHRARRRDRARRRGVRRARRRDELAGRRARRRGARPPSAPPSRRAAARRSRRPRDDAAPERRATMAPFLVAAGAMFAVMYSTQAILPDLARRVRRLAVAGRAEHLGRDRRARRRRLVLGPAVGPDRAARVARARERRDRRADAARRARAELRGAARAARAAGAVHAGADHRRRAVRDRGVRAALGSRAMGYYISALVAGGLVGRVGVALRHRGRTGASRSACWRCSRSPRRC